MKQAAVNTFKSYIEPVFRRPDYVQAAALCLRDGDHGLEVLVISSLSTKRWILPKGWPMPNRTLAQAAMQEAWEEAGVIGSIDEQAIGAFSYQKCVKGGVPITCRCQVFRATITDMVDDYPEQGRRQRAWVTPAKAAMLVEEPELQALILALE